MTLARLIIFAIVAQVMTVGGGVAAWAKPAAVTAYPLPAVYGASRTFSLKANGTDVPVIAFSDQYDYAVFSAGDGDCKLEVARTDGKTIEHHSISPLKLRLAGTASRNHLTFSIDQPAYLIVSVDNLRKLVIAIDPPEADKPAASGEHIYNVAAPAYGADRT